MRDEAVRFSDFSIEEVNLNTTTIPYKELFASFPNPVHEKLEISNEIMQQFNKLRLFDITGKLLLEKGNLLNEIDVSFLKTGMYFIRFSNKQNQSVSIKIIKI